MDKNMICPNCRLMKAKIYKKDFGKNTVYWIKCSYCMSQTKLYQTSKEAVKYWNVKFLEES